MCFVVAADPGGHQLQQRPHRPAVRRFRLPAVRWVARSHLHLPAGKGPALLSPTLTCVAVVVTSWHFSPGNRGLSDGAHLRHSVGLQWHHRPAGGVLLEQLTGTEEEEEERITEDDQ